MKFAVLPPKIVLVLVAPYMGAWIEIDVDIKRLPLSLAVAPYMGAWIEITMHTQNLLIIMCRTLHGCVD